MNLIYKQENFNVQSVYCRKKMIWLRITFLMIWGPLDGKSQRKFFTLWQISLHHILISQNICKAFWKYKRQTMNIFLKSCFFHFLKNKSH